MKDRQFKDLGIGIGLRPAHYDDFLSDTRSTNTPLPAWPAWVEVVSENFMNWPSQALSQPRSVLRRVREQVPIALHGVSLSIGSATGLNPAYLKELKNLADEIEPVWMSDHLCWTGVSGENLHDLLPLPYTAEAVRVVSENVDRVQTALGRRILIENVSSYVEFQHSEMTEWEFLREIAETADCGLLLDVNNVYVSSVNHRFDPLTYLKHVPRDRVGQIHLAGHSIVDNYLIDTHDAPICQEVWDLYTWVHRNFGARSTMIERDGNIPAWSELINETKMIRQIREKSSGQPLAEITADAI